MAPGLTSHSVCPLPWPHLPVTTHTHTHTHTNACTHALILTAEVPFQPWWNTSHFLTASVKQHTVTTFTHDRHAPQLPLCPTHTHTHTQTLLHCRTHYSVSVLISKVKLQNWSRRTFSSLLTPTTGTSPSCLRRPSCAPLTLRDKWR